MVSVYIKSVIIWMIILTCTFGITSESLVKKGWFENAKKPKYGKFLMVCAVPVVRLVLWLAIISMAFVQKPDEK